MSNTWEDEIICGKNRREERGYLCDDFIVSGAKILNKYHHTSKYGGKCAKKTIDEGESFCFSLICSDDDRREHILFTRNSLSSYYCTWH